MQARLNLLFFLVILLVSSWRANAPRHQWEESWHDTLDFGLVEPNGFYHQWLEIENDRYRVLGFGCTGARVEERGYIELRQGNLELHSDRGQVTTWKLLHSGGVTVNVIW